MNERDAPLAAEFFFLPGAEGQLFGAFHRAAERSAKRGGILFVPPFAEELNKSRRMSSVQARQFARLGYDVLVVDLYGSGDSSGDFGEATWDVWIEDLTIAFDWLSARTKGGVSLWALRMGALLAVELLDSLEAAVPKAILWQPIPSGDIALAEFLRVHIAGERLGGKVVNTTLKDLQDRLAAGESLRVGGYELNPSLALSIGAASLLAHTPTHTELHWLEVSYDGKAELGAASQDVVGAWRERGVSVFAKVVEGPKFWSTTEITECPLLLSATETVLSDLPA